MISKLSHVEMLRWAEQDLSQVEQGSAGCIIFLTNEEIGALKYVQGHKGKLQPFLSPVFRLFL